MRTCLASVPGAGKSQCPRKTFKKSLISGRSGTCTWFSCGIVHPLKRVNFPNYSMTTDGKQRWVREGDTCIKCGNLLTADQNSFRVVATPAIGKNASECVKNLNQVKINKKLSRGFGETEENTKNSRRRLSFFLCASVLVLLLVAVI